MLLTFTLSQTYPVTFQSYTRLKIQCQLIKASSFIFFALSPLPPSLGFPWGTGTCLFFLILNSLALDKQEGLGERQTYLYFIRFALQSSGGDPCHCSSVRDHQQPLCSRWTPTALSKEWCVTWGDLWEPHGTHPTLPQLDSSGLPKFVPSIHSRGGQFLEWLTARPPGQAVNFRSSEFSFLLSISPVISYISWNSQGVSGTGVIVQVSSWFSHLLISPRECT